VFERTQRCEAEIADALKQEEARRAAVLENMHRLRALRLARDLSPFTLHPYTLTPTKCMSLGVGCAGETVGGSEPAIVLPIAFAENGRGSKRSNQQTG
jgi:hypothetical protein